MAVSDSVYENVVSQIFDSLEYGVVKIPTNTLMELIEPYIGNNVLECSMLREILDPYSNNSSVDKNDLKTALSQWAENLNSQKEACIIQDSAMSSNYDASENVQYSSGSSICNESYNERITELQNEVDEREYMVGRLKKQLEIAINQTQLHEEALAGLTQERDLLQLKLRQIEQQNTVLVGSMKQEYDELLETLNGFRKELKIMTNKLDHMKKKNTLLNSNIAELNNEKHSLSIKLSKSNKEKSKVVSLLSAAESNNAILKSECLHFKDRIEDMEKTISHLTTVKNSLEINLQNTSLLYKSHQRSYSCDENSNEGSENAIDKYDFSQIACKGDTQSLDDSKEKEVKFGESCITSTPRNQLSLMQEFNQAPMEYGDVSTPPAGGNGNKFHFFLSKINLDEGPKYNAKEKVDSSISPYDSKKQAPVKISNSCQLTYVLDENSLKEKLNKFEAEFRSRLSTLEKDFRNFNDINKSIVKKLNNYNNEIVDIKRTVKAFETRIVEIKTHETLLGFNIWSIHRRLRALQYVFKEQLKSSKAQIRDSEMFLESGTQTECNPAIGNMRDDNALLKVVCVNKNESSGCIARLRRCCSYILQKVWFWGTIFCLVMACIRLYNTMKYCSTVRQGSVVRIFPWNWITVQELLSSIFDYDTYGQVPI